MNKINTFLKNLLDCIELDTFSAFYWMICALQSEAGF